MAKTLHGMLLEQGFEVTGIIKNSKLPEVLTRLALEYARGVPPFASILSGEVAFAGSKPCEEGGLMEPIYIIYEKKEQAEEEPTAGPYFEFKDPSNPESSLFYAPSDKDIR
jgi:hypothetical protein